MDFNSLYDAINSVEVTTASSSFKQIGRAHV